MSWLSLYDVQTDNKYFILIKIFLIDIKQTQVL